MTTSFVKQFDPKANLQIEIDANNDAQLSQRYDLSNNCIVPESVLSYLPPSMIDSVELLPNQNERLILFTRHSLRELTKGKGFASHDLKLTDVGKELAIAWGAWLSNNLNYSMDTMSVSSPISRCINTAKLIQQGAGVNQPVEEEPLLVEPGSLVLDAKVAHKKFKQIGAINFINAYLNNELASTKSAVQGGLDILSLLYSSQPKPSHMALAVSHDTLLAAFLAVMMQNKQISKEDWPKMLEGVFLWFDNKPFETATVNLIWRSHHFKLPTAELMRLNKI